MSQHRDFILKPVSSILVEATQAMSGISGGIESAPVCDYLFPSLLLRMTGFQEQKCKCIAWELATNDYEYRYDRYTHETLGECSVLNEKNTVFRDILKEIGKIDSSFSTSAFIDATAILSDAKTCIENFYNNTPLVHNRESEYQSYLTLCNCITVDCLVYPKGDSKALFTNCSSCKYKDKAATDFIKCTIGNFQFPSIYGKTYMYRNRYAHNTTSYQTNFPSIGIMKQPDYQLENHFLMFLSLMIIDGMMVQAYQKWLEITKQL